MKLSGHSREVLSLDVFDGKLVSGSEDLTARVWDLTSKKAIFGFKMEGFVNCVKFDTHLVQIASNSSVISLNNLKIG